MTPVADVRVDAAEGELRVRFPVGYRTFMSRYGPAFYSNDIRVYDPESLVQQNRERLGEGECFFWRAPQSALDRDRTPECIRYADTIFGDVLAVHPSIEGASFLFPRSNETIHRFDGDLEDVLDWVLSSGTCLAPTKARYVEPLRRVPGFSTSWQPVRRAGEIVEAPGFDETIQRLTSLDSQSRVFHDLVNGERRAEVFLPSYEARLRVEDWGPDESAEVEGLSFLDDEASKASFHARLNAIGLEVTEAA